MTTNNYGDGTLSVENGETAVTGTGTAWSVLGVGHTHFVMIDVPVDGDIPALRYPALLQVDANGTATLLDPWSGATVVDTTYRILRIYDGAVAQQQLRDLVEQMRVITANGRGLFYLFDTGTTDADPGDGEIRFNHASIGSATAAYIDNLDANGATVSSIVDAWDDGTSSVKGQLSIRSIASPAAFHSFNVTGTVVDGTGYRKLTLTYVGGSGTFAAADELMVMFLAKGDAGQAGSAGITLTYDTTTADADPGAGKFRLNHATPASATVIYLDNVEALAGASITALIDSWDDGNPTIKGQLKLTNAADPTIFRIFNVTGAVVDGTGYRKVTIASVTGAGTFVNGAQFQLSFVVGGNNGLNGVTAGLRYNFDSTTTDADPGAGDLRLNHATIASATGAYLDNVDADGATVTGTLDTWDDSTSTVKGQLLIRSATTPATFALFSVSGSVVDGTGYRKLTLTYLTGNGTLSNAEALSVQFYRTGDAGGGASAASDAEQEAGSSTTVATTPGRQHRHPSAAKWLLKADAAGGILANYNVTSISDDGTGLLTVSIGTDFSGGDHVTFGLPYSLGTRFVMMNGAPAAGSVTFRCSDGSTSSDPIAWFLGGFGDQ